MLIQWISSLSVGVEQIDEQHRELIAKVGNLKDLIASRCFRHHPLFLAIKKITAGAENPRGYLVILV